MQGCDAPFRRSILVMSIISLCLTVSSCTTNCNTIQCQTDTLLPNSEVGQDFISAVVSVPCGQTNIVYYAGTSSNVFVLVHQTNVARRFWNLHDVNLDKSIWCEISDDPRK